MRPTTYDLPQTCVNSTMDILSNQYEFNLLEVGKLQFCLCFNFEYFFKLIDSTKYQPQRLYYIL